VVSISKILNWPFADQVSSGSTARSVNGDSPHGKGAETADL